MSVKVFVAKYSEGSPLMIRWVQVIAYISGASEGFCVVVTSRSGVLYMDASVCLSASLPLTAVSTSTEGANKDGPISQVAVWAASTPIPEAVGSLGDSGSRPPIKLVPAAIRPCPLKFVLLYFLSGATTSYDPAWQVLLTY